MHKLQNGSQIVAKPPLKNTTGSLGYFTESGDDGVPSYPGADWFNASIDELACVLTAAGIEFESGKFDHLARGIANLASSAASKVSEELVVHAEHDNPHPAYALKTDMAEALAQHGVNFEKYITNSPAFYNTDNSVKTACQLDVKVGTVVYSFVAEAEITMPALNVGTDYAIYATSDGLIASANYTTPDGYTAENSRRVGGFHYGDGYIYPYSFWDLKFRPSCDDPRGMVRTFRGFWADIYLLNVTPDLLGTSAYNAQIADGSSTPKIPAVWGGDGAEQYSSFTQYIATEVLSAYGKRLPASAEFELLAMGSVPGYVTASDPVTTQFNAESRSFIDCEQVSGHLWQWGAEKWDRGDGTSGYAWSSVDTNGEGQVFDSGSYGVGASLFGATWGYAGSAGSRASNWHGEPWYSSSNVSARGVCDHLQLL